jgi:hypothetical protein
LNKEQGGCHPVILYYSLKYLLMIQFSSNLMKEVDQSLRQINAKNFDTLKKAGELTIVLKDAFERLRTFVCEYRFKNEEEEMLFFKQIKPSLLCDLIYYRKVYNIELNRPIGGDMEVRNYLEKELCRIKDFFDKNNAIYRYYRSGETSNDRQYFLRGHFDNTLYQESFSFERDPLFSTSCDYKIAKILANNQVEDYILTELAKVDDLYNLPFPKVRLTWTGSKIDLMELIYGQYCVQSLNHGEVSLSQIIEYYEFIYNIDLTHTSERAWYDLTIRENPTTYIDKMRRLFRERMEKGDAKNNKYKRKKDDNNDCIIGN